MVKTLILSLSLIYSTVMLSSASQDTLEFAQLSIKDGLSNSNVTSFYQDSNNFLWIGTNDGLCRYNGTSFKVFRNDPFNSNSLSGQCINSLIGTKNHTGELIWIATCFNGVSAFNTEKHTFQQFKNQTGTEDLLSDNRCLKLRTLSNGLVAVISVGGIDFIDPLTFKIYKDPYQLFSPLELVEKDDRLYIGSRDGIKVLKAPVLQNGQYVFPANNKRTLLPHLEVYQATFIEKSLYLGCTKGFYKYDLESESLGRIKLPEADDKESEYLFHPFVVDKLSEKIYLPICGLGVYSFDVENNSIEELSGADFKETAQTTSLFFDKFGYLWLGSHRLGALKASMSPENFQGIKIKDSRASIDANDIYSVNVLPNSYLVAGNSTGGIYILKDGRYQYALLPQDQNPFLGNRSIIGSLFYDEDNSNLWIGNMAKSLMVVPLTAQDISRRHISGEPIVFRGDSAQGGYNISGWSVRVIEKDDSGFIWAGTFDGGITKLQADNLQKKTVVNNPLLLEIRNLLNPRIEWDNMFFIATSRGLVLFNTENNKLFHATEWPLSKEMHPVLSSPIFAVHQESLHRFWLCTASYGLVLLEFKPSEVRSSNVPFNIKSVEVTCFNEKNGIPAGELLGVLEDDDNNLWISSDKGLIRFSKTTQKAKLFTKHDRIDQTIYNVAAYVKDKASDSFYFGGSSGITCFKPSKIIEVESPSIPIISEIRLAGKELKSGDTLSSGYILKKHISFSDSIRLAYHENMLSFRLNIINSKDAFSNHMFYKLEGVDKEWQKADGTENVVTYSFINPGRYTMRLKAENLVDGSEDTFIIEVMPPWWFSKLAYVLYSLLVIAALFTFRWIILYRERYKNQLAIERIEFKKSAELAKQTHELDQMRIRFFMNISHEFRTPLTLMLGPLNKLPKVINDPKAFHFYFDLISRNTNRLLRLINQLLDFRKLEMKQVQLNLQKEDILAFVQDLMLMYKDEAESKGLALNFIADADRIEIAFDADIVEKVTLNLISNALKYTPQGGSVTVSALVDENNNSFKINVADTGIGIPDDQQEMIFQRFHRLHTDKVRVEGIGIGLSYSRELAVLHKGSLEYEQNQEQGSVFSFSFPLNLEQMYPNLYDTKEESQVQEKVLFKPEWLLPGNGAAQTTDRKQRNHSYKLLIVEDNPDIATYLQSCLKDDYETLLATNGAEALSVIDSDGIDMIISDVMMPIMDGIAFTMKVKSNPETSHIPVILLTARTSEDAEIEGLYSGADDYITKPFNEQIIKLKITNFFTLRNQLAKKILSGTAEPEIKLHLSDFDQKFIIQVNDLLKKHISDSNLTSDFLAEQIGVGRTLLFKKFRSLLNTSVSEYILSLRMKTAQEYLTRANLNISEICYEVGFSDPKYFSRIFKKHFNCTPSEYRQSFHFHEKGK